ncbi:MAG: hypothetical protein B7W99_00890 [Rhodospirillales bacterium 20-58-10]|nr:MAG: hypothetical protein B7W99_00890 [Rhodospirillales bacterium 20-58-10]
MNLPHRNHSPAITDIPRTDRGGHALCRSAIAMAVLFSLSGNSMAQDPKAKYGLAGLQMTAADNAAYKNFGTTNCASIIELIQTNKPSGNAYYNKMSRIYLMNLDMSFIVESIQSHRGDKTPLADLMSENDWLSLPDKAAVYCRILKSQTVGAALTAVYKDARTAAGVK